MYPIDSLRLFLLGFLIQINPNTCQNDDHFHMEIITRLEHMNVQFPCDLPDVTWWKRPHLLATRYGMILPRYRSKMSLERILDDPPKQIFHISQLQSNDSGVYECETLGAIRQFNLTVLVRLSSVELGVQYESNDNHWLNQTDRNHSQRLLKLRENQLIRLTCVVSRALPAAILHFPFDVDYRIERNSTIENDDQTYRSILVLILRINRYFHQRLFFCQAIQYPIQQDEQIRIRSNVLQIDVAYSPICSHKFTLQPPQFYTGIGRSINLTCHMNNGNPARNNFTWHLPNGQILLGNSLNLTSSSLTITPQSYLDFGQVICRAQNELGLFGECSMNMSLGGIPDPIESCHYTYINATLTVNCLAGFHQGDEEFFCYMYKRQPNGSYSEHARLKGNCAFILPDLKPEYHHDFRVFTRNKYGDNFDRSYSIQVGKAKETLAERTRTYWPYMTLLTIGAFLASFVLICCLCYKIRNSLYKKRTSKGNFENLTYENHTSYPSHIDSNGKTSLVYEKGNGNPYPVRPYRSRDYLISSEPSTLYRSNLPYFDDDSLGNRKSIYKETDLDRIRTHPNDTMKTLPMNRVITSDSHEDQQINPPLTMQRRSSFQAATQLNNFDFYSNPESYLFVDKSFMSSIDRHPSYSSESDRHNHDYSSTSSYSKINNPNSQQRAKAKQTSVEISSKYIFNNDDGIFV